MRLQVEVPAFVHRNAPVYHGAIQGVGSFVLAVGVGLVRRVESCVVTLANNDYGHLGWWRLLSTIDFLTLVSNRLKLGV